MYAIHRQMYLYVLNFSCTISTIHRVVSTIIMYLLQLSIGALLFAKKCFFCKHEIQAARRTYLRRHANFDANCKHDKIHVSTRCLRR